MEGEMRTERDDGEFEREPREKMESLRELESWRDDGRRRKSLYK